MSVSPAPSLPEEAAASAYEEIALLNRCSCDGDHFGWFCETINAMFLKQSIASTFGQIQLGTCIFAKFPEASVRMRECICSILVKASSQCRSSSLSIIVWALRSLWRSGCSSDNLQLFSTYLAQHAAVHSDAAAPLMLSHSRHHIVDALYYNLIAIKCLQALSMRSVDRVPSSLQVGRLLPKHIQAALADVDSKPTALNSSSRSNGGRGSIHSIEQDTAVQRILSNMRLRVCLCMKLLGFTYESPMEENDFVLQLLQSNCTHVPFRLQNSTSEQQPSHLVTGIQLSRLVAGIQASVVFQSSIYLAVPQPSLQRVPEAFTQELDRLKSRNSRDSVTRRDTTTRSYASSNSPGHESVVVELYHCGYVEKLQIGGNVRSWHWRWFEIDQIFISYFRSHYHPEPINRIHLSRVLSVMYARTSA